jgi:hypothetical protein
MVESGDAARDCGGPRDGKREFSDVSTRPENSRFESPAAVAADLRYIR